MSPPGCSILPFLLSLSCPHQAVSSGLVSVRRSAECSGSDVCCRVCQTGCCLSPSGSESTPAEARRPLNPGKQIRYYHVHKFMVPKHIKQMLWIAEKITQVTYYLRMFKLLKLARTKTIILRWKKYFICQELMHLYCVIVDETCPFLWNSSIQIYRKS